MKDAPPSLAWGIPVVLCVRGIHSAVFGPLTASEKSDLQTQMLSTLCQVAVAMMCFREPVGVRTIVTLLPPLALKWFHKVAAFRASQTGRRRKRLGILLAVLHLCDMAWLHAMSASIFRTEGCSPLALALAAEIAILYGELLAVTGQFLWPQSRIFWTLLNLYAATIKLFVYWALSYLLLSKWYLPVHILRDSYATLRLGINYLSEAVVYRRATKKFQLSFVKVDDSCPICFESLDDPTVQTSCGHALHLQCVATWLRLNGTCPVCRRPQAKVPLSGPSPVPESLSESGVSVSETQSVSGVPDIPAVPVTEAIIY